MRASLDALDVSPTERAKIHGGNAARLYGLR
jgi:hypothetical protein